MTAQRRKLIVLGLDGATFDVVDPLVGKGILPNMEKFMRNGVRARLISTIPPVTGPAWVSFMTGKSPENHGIFDFVTRTSPNELRRRIVNHEDIKSRTLWSILTQNGKKIGMINVPMTYPLPHIRGFAIPGMLTPGNALDFAYPPHVIEDVKSVVGRYIPDVWWQLYSKRRIKPFLRHLISCTVQRARISLFLMQKYEWDFFMVVLTGTDRIQHALWQFISAILGEGALSREQNGMRSLIVRYFQEIDTFVGHVAQLMDHRTQLIIMSDHGFGPLEGKFHINGWLRDHGFLTWDEQKAKRLTVEREIRRVVGKMDFLKLRRRLLSNISPRPARMQAYSFLECIEWSKTRAYAASNTEQGIYVNLRGREPWGIVQPGEEYEQTRSEIITQLSTLRDPDSNDGLVSSIYKREEVYDQGTYASDAPDIIFFLKGGEYLADVELKDSLFEERSWKTGSGTHRREGIFIGGGTDIQEGLHINDVRIIDLAPTILNMFGLSIPDDMDGRVLTEIFTKSFLQANVPTYTEADGESILDTRDGTRYSEEDEELVRDQLRGLGYL